MSASPAAGPPSRSDARRWWIALLGLTALVLWLRFTGLGFQLPVATVNDERVYYEQFEAFSSDVPEPAALPRAGFYPHLVSRIAHATWSADDAVPTDVAGHLAAASAIHLHIRTIVALLSMLAIPGMWMFARAFVDRRTAIVATAFCALSPFVQCYAQEGRPHAVVFALVLVTMGFALRFGREPTFAHAIGAAVGAGLAIATLQSAFLLLAPIGVAILVAPGIAMRRRLAYSALVLLVLAAAFRLGYPFLFLASIDPETQRGHSLLGEAGMGLDWFDGSGFLVLLQGLWTYESIPMLAVGVGLVAFAFRASSTQSRAAATVPERREREATTFSGRARELGRRALKPATWSASARSLAIAAAFFVPYALAFGAYSQSKPRYALLLVPVLALTAAIVLVPRADRGTSLVRWIPVMFVLVAEAASVVRFAIVRAQPDTNFEAARWIESRLPAHAKIGLLRGDDLPLLRLPERRAEFAGMYFGSHSPWLQHQAHLGAGPWDGAARDLSTLEARNRDEFQAALDASDLEYVIWRDLGNPDRPNLRAARAAIEARGELMATFRPCRDDDPRPFVPREETYDFPVEGFWLGRLWRAERVGRVTEIWKLDRRR